MNPSSDLFFLIKSLTKNEKRYFKLNASLQQGDKKYVQLFDAIAAQDVYDEKKIILEGKGHTTRLNLLKSSLYQKIMDSLDAFYETDSAEKWLKKQIRQTEILYKRRLYTQAIKLIKKAKHVSEKYEKHALHIELLFWEYELIKFLPNPVNFSSEVETIFVEINNCMEKLQNYISYRYFSSKIFSKRIHTGHSRKSAEKEELEKIIRNPLLKDESMAQSYTALFYFYSSYIAYYGFTNEEKKKYEFTRKSVELFEKYPHEIKENTARYVSVIHNHLNCLSDLKNYAELRIFLSKLKQIKTDNELVRNMLEYFVPQIELNLYVETCDFESATKLVAKIEKLIKSNEFNPPNKQVEVFIYYYSTQVNLYTGNFKAANYFINKIIHNTSHNIRDDVYCFAKILQLITYYEMEDVVSLDSSIRSTYRYLLKRERNYKFETLLLQFFRKKAAKLTTQKLRILAFKELQQGIYTLLKDPFEKNIMAYFNFTAWLESKIKGKNLMQLLNERM